MSEITQPPPEIQSQDTNTRVNRLGAASDQSSSNKQSAEQQSGKPAPEAELEKQPTHHDPAVTLASTLSKLDSGSYFTATVSGKDGDGRTIISSDLGTYLVEVDIDHAEAVKNIKKDEVIELRVITIDKEIKADIIRPPTDVSESLRPTLIPVHLILTELGQNLDLEAHKMQASLMAKQTPLDDVRSQYQATTLYKAERIARDIADKLENLPLPTSSPNYTVYGASKEPGSLSTVAVPKQVSANIFIQEVTSPNPATLRGNTQIQQTLLQQIVGQNINTEVIKSVPRTPTPLPAGLPASVIKEINALTPLDYTNVGQKITIHVSAVAVPENSEMQSAVSKNVANKSPAAHTPPLAQSVEQSPNKAPNTMVTEQSSNANKDVVMSGIIIDPSQSKSLSGNESSNRPPHAPSATNMAYGNQVRVPHGTSQRKENTSPPSTYFLATPTSVLKFDSKIPLVPGTIVSFTVQENSKTLGAQATAQPTVEPSPKENVAQPSTTVAAVTPSVSAPPSTETIPSDTSSTASISPGLIDRIEHFYPQELGQLLEDWGSISLALSALVSSSSQSMAAILSSRIPNMQNPGQLTSSIFFFLSALKAPSPARTWVGPDVSARLKKLGVEKIIGKMDHDFTRISRLSTEAPAGEWRPYLIPLQNGPEITAIPMLTKQIVDHEQNENKQNENEGDEEVKIKATRFILELKFSQFGMVIIDGMLKENRLDIILKSIEQMQFATKMKLSRKFHDALIKNNFEGELVIIDNAPIDISVRQMIETMGHKISIEKKI